MVFISEKCEGARRWGQYDIFVFSEEVVKIRGKVPCQSRHTSARSSAATTDFYLTTVPTVPYFLQDLLKDEVDGEDAGRSLARSGLIHDQVLMGKQATDIVIGALQKVSTVGFPRDGG